jgi:hypothetical protein
MELRHPRELYGLHVVPTLKLGLFSPLKLRTELSFDLISIHIMRASYHFDILWRPINLIGIWFD